MGSQNINQPIEVIVDPITLLAALGPLAVDLGKSLINRFISSDTYKPANIDEFLKMKDSEMAMFNALNNAGGANPSYPWVEAVVRLMRPVVAIVALGVWSYSRTLGTPAPEIDNFAAAIGFYLFGDRTLFYSKKGK